MLLIIEYKCPNTKCELEMTYETDVKVTKRPKCSGCNRLMIEERRTQTKPRKLKKETKAKIKEKEIDRMRSIYSGKKKKKRNTK